MTTNHTRRLTLLASLGALALALSAPIAAIAAPVADTLQTRVDAVLSEFPGGTQTGLNQITWDGGAMILTLEDTSGGIGLFAVGSCATGYHCAYSGNALSGNKLSLSGCDTTHSTAALGVVRSIANAHSSGYVQAKNASGSVLSTVYAGGSVGYAPAGITQLTCVS